MKSVIRAGENFKLENATVYLKPWDNRYAIYFDSDVRGAVVCNVYIIRQSWKEWFINLFKRKS